MAQRLLKCPNPQHQNKGPHRPVRMMPGDAHALDPVSSCRRSVLVTKWHGGGESPARQLIQLSQTPLVR